MAHQRVRLGDLSISFVHCLIAALHAKGVDPSDLLRRFRIDAQRLAQPRARLSIPRYMRLGHSAIALCGDPALGLEMGLHSHISQIGLAGVTAAQAPTVKDAARTLIEFEALYAHNYRGHSSFSEDAQGAWMSFYSISPYNDFNRFVVDSVLSGWRYQLAGLLSKGLEVERVEIEFADPGYRERYEAYFDCPVVFGAAQNRLRLSASVLTQSLPQHCPSTWQQMLELATHEREQLTRLRSLRERVTHLLGPMLHGRVPELEDVALKLGLPSWTLRRKLAEEGTQYRELLNETRRDLAMAYIRDTELRFGEMAYLLGFASAEAFQRAFKRWSGRTPGEYRRDQRLSAAQSSVASSAGSAGS